MSSRQERKMVVESGSPLIHHSLNQRKLKSGREGEGRIFKRELSDDQNNEKCECFDNPNFMPLLERTELLEESNVAIPIRIGQLSLLVSSLINGQLRDNPDNFIDNNIDNEIYTFEWGTPNKKLIPKNEMILNMIKKMRNYRITPQVRKSLDTSADLFALSLGQITFNEDTHTTASVAVVGLDNISKFLADGIKGNYISVPFARTLVVTFGETIDRKLAKPRR